MDQSSQSPDMNAALSGIRVIDLSHYDAGMSCAESLAWLGADVVRVEAPGNANARYATTEKPGVDSYEFILLNANKRSVTCDLETEQGRNDLRKLIANADVLIEHLAPGAIERLGFGYDAVKKINPAVIFVQMKCFASDSPRASYLSSDTIAQALGGAIAGTGYAGGGTPLICGPTVGDTGAALNGVMGVLAALFQRRSTGRGQRVESMLQGAVVNLCRNQYHAQLLRGKPTDRMGNSSRSAAAPSNLFACKPGGLNDHVFIHISKSANRHWQRLLQVIGRAELVSDPRFIDNDARVKNLEEVEKLVSGWCREHTKVEAMEAVQGLGTPAGAVLDAQELSADANLRARGMMVTVDHPARGAVTMPGWPVKMSDSRVPVRAAPLLGAHTQEVLTEWLAPRSVSTAVSVGASKKQALAGIRVVDFTQLEAGTSCTEPLAWLGADVVKVEEPNRGEKGRSGNTEKPGVDAHYFIVLNANKRSIRCDVKSERGKEIVRELVKKADILVENMAPGAIERLGFGYDVVRQLNPRIIFAQVKGFPSEGPHAKYLCLDMIAQSAGGGLAATGLLSNQPLKPGPNMGDSGAGMHGTTGILAALFQREKTGRGQRVEISMQEAVINFNRNSFARTLATGKAPTRGEIPSTVKEVFACKGGGRDDYCCVEISRLNDDQWQALLRVVGGPGAGSDPRFASSEARSKNSSALESLMAAWCGTRDKIEAMDMMQHAGIPAGAVFSTRDLANDAEQLKTGQFASIQHPVRGTMSIPAWAVRMSDSPVQVRSAPLLGEHTEAVLSEWLGMDPQAIAEFSSTAGAVAKTA